ncbi:hypothetical protein H6P81_015481 [Aristolochia fimbriata]|uniref:Uncharacterized protein n=1 Tax=Aristolochia fimbriata TaxID=158543 RepID=A0AAV7E6Y8_ARIFI|nr:hypothetical protein H6P81_015481 [Aristolochia fimbriata]
MIIVTYIQDNKSWGFGFCLPCFSIVAAFALFLVGTPCYRFTRTKNRGGLGKSFFRDVGDESRDVPFSSIFAPDEERLLNEARDVRKWTWTGLIEEAKQVSNLIPIWATCIFYGVVAAQPPSLFTKQGGAMDRRFPGHDFQVPAAALQSCIAFTMVVLLPIYDRVFVPAARLFTKLPSGITMLQRIGTGLLVSVAAMVAAAAVERRRLALAGAAEAAAAARMSVWWLLPQYVLFGVAHVFVYVGSSEFFYDQMPEGLRSLGIAFCLTIFGVGSFLSGILVWVVDAASSANGASWFDTDLDRAHLDYFYWLVAATSATGFGLFLYLAKSYVYKIK